MHLVEHSAARMVASMAETTVEPMVGPTAGTLVVSWVV